MEELRLSSGFGWQGRIDFYAISPSPSTGNLATAYEVKVSKSDFQKDTHAKQRGARLYSDKFYYVTPKGMIQPEKIPDWAGLKEVEWKVLHGEEYLSITEKIPAPKLDKSAPSWGLVCSMLRRNKTTD